MSVLEWLIRETPQLGSLLRGYSPPVSSVRPEGFEPPPAWVKARDAAVTPRPQSWSGVSVSIVVVTFSVSFVFFRRVARGGIEPPPPLYQNDMLPLEHRAVRNSEIRSTKLETNQNSQIRMPKTSAVSRFFVFVLRILNLFRISKFVFRSSREGGIRTHDLVFPKHAGCHCPTSR